jgi:CheY-like chemotaxis protein
MGYHNILLIDDDEDDQDIFLEAVGQLSNAVKCIAVGSAIEALKKLSKEEIIPDVIFLDLNMPVMNGQQFLMEINKSDTLRKIPVIIFSTAHPPSLQTSNEMGAVDFITKPGMYNELVSILAPIIGPDVKENLENPK